MMKEEIRYSIDSIQQTSLAHLDGIKGDMQQYLDQNNFDPSILKDFEVISPGVDKFKMNVVQRNIRWLNFGVDMRFPFVFHCCSNEIDELKIEYQRDIDDLKQKISDEITKAQQSIKTDITLYKIVTYSRDVTVRNKIDSTNYSFDVAEELIKMKLDLLRLDILLNLDRIKAYLNVVRRKL